MIVFFFHFSKVFITILSPINSYRSERTANVFKFNAYRAALLDEICCEELDSQRSGLYE